MDANLLLSFFEAQLGRTLDDSVPPQRLSGMEVIAALWPLNDVFRPRMTRIKTLRYRERFEAEADEAIVQAAFSGSFASWDMLTAGAWRVLMERHVQSLMVAAANEVRGNPLMTVPTGCDEATTRGGAMIFLMHGMKLPWPPRDRSRCELPEGQPTASLTLH